MFSTVSAWSGAMKPQVAPEALKVHGIFRSHMVLQRDKPVAVWGWAEAGEKVTVAVADQKAPGGSHDGSDRIARRRMGEDRATVAR